MTVHVIERGRRAMVEYRYGWILHEDGAEVGRVDSGSAAEAWLNHPVTEPASCETMSP